MKYKVWDMISYGHGEPLKPFTKIFESNDLNEIRKYIDDHEDQHLTITSGDKIIADTSKKIFERVDDQVFERSPLSMKRRPINWN